MNSVGSLNDNIDQGKASPVNAYEGMKILIATPIFIPDVGGPATHTEEIAQILVKRGFIVTVVTYSDFNDEEDVNVYPFEIIRISRKIPQGIRHLIYFFKLFNNSKNANVIYALDPTATGIPARFTAMLLRKKFLVRIGGDLLWERAAVSEVFRGSMQDFYTSGEYLRFKRLTFQAIKFVLRHADTIIVHSKFLIPIYNNYYKTNKEKIIFISNAVQIEQNAPVTTTEKKEKIILFAGRFVNYKNIDVLIEVF